jgi:hypothetical protein
MIAAKRILRVRDSKGETLVPVQIEVPVPDRTAWTCNFSIDWPEGRATGYATAFDAVQALLFAMERVAILLYVSSYHNNHTLLFEEPGEGYGFPLPRDSRHMAIGLDKTL